MPKITRGDVEYVAGLARLVLDESAKEQLADQLGRILNYVAKLNELDTSDVEPMMHVLELTNVFREDVVQRSLDRETALQNAPRTDGQYFLVPRILDVE